MARGQHDKETKLKEDYMVSGDYIIGSLHSEGTKGKKRLHSEGGT